MHRALQNTWLATDLSADEYGSPWCSKPASSVVKFNACYLYLPNIYLKLVCSIDKEHSHLSTKDCMNESLEGWQQEAE